ncbi:tetratricopeptide repeat protein [Treponema primitia]|uniref:tetratricopeptide repeat protein n=1 Tax=Treponema primitia TaxID=88058 RepID=UPI000255516D|nr:tetratricopeptide repeat protein [Treponema primitia]
MISRQYKALFFLLFLAFGRFARLSALDFTLRPRPFLLIPQGEVAELYAMGYGGDLLFDLDVSSILTNPWGLGYSLGLEGGYAYANLAEGAEGDIQLYSAGAGARFFGYPLSRLALSLDGALGLSQAIQHYGHQDDGSAASWYWRAGAEAGFRFAPFFTLSLNGGYRYYHNEHRDGALYHGLSAGLTFQFTLSTKSAAGLRLDLIQEEPVYPLFLSLYQRNGAGTLRISNHENAEIRNVRVSFRAGQYTSSEINCGNIGFIGRFRSVELPLYADFAPALLNFTEDGRILGEVVIRYTFLGAERTAVISSTVRVVNRNAYRWGDNASLAAFVSPTAPAPLEYAKYVVGLARSKRRTGLNQNMQFSLWLYEGLLTAGLRQSAGSNRVTDIDSIQFPSETLAFRSGNAVDIGLLYANTLESSGIPAAIIALEDDFMVLYSLGISQAAAGALFTNIENLLVINDEVWMPLSMVNFNNGFMNSWEGGSKRLNRAFEAGETLDFIRFADAWAAYPPVVPAVEAQSARPEESALNRRADTALAIYIATEFEPKIAALEAQLRTNPGAASFNQLGLLLLRASRPEDAKPVFEQAASYGSAAGMVNRGNLSLLDKDFAGAEAWFRRALGLNPENAAAKNGLARTTLQRGE